MCPFWFGKITITFTLLFGHHQLSGRQIFRKLKTSETQVTRLSHSGLTDSFSASTELCNVYLGLQSFVLEIFDFSNLFFGHSRSKPRAINLQIRWLAIQRIRTCWSRNPWAQDSLGNRDWGRKTWTVIDELLGALCRQFQKLKSLGEVGQS
jgi:hypothetical protein